MSTPTSSIFTLRYGDAAAASTSSSSSSPAMATSYSLVELPPALLAGIQKQASTSTSSPSTLPTDLVIKGQPSDDAVLCTQDATYNLRAVKNSNSLLLCRPTSKDKGKGKASSLEIESTLHQTLELELVVPKLDRIGELLKGSDWSPEIAEEERTAKKRKRAHKQLSREDILDLVPASDGQIEAALRARHVLEVDGECRLLAPGALVKLLKNILQTILLLSQTPVSFSLTDLSESLERDDSIPRSITEQLVSWFRQPVQSEGKDADLCELRLDQIAKEIGRELLASKGSKAVSKEQFMEEWRLAIGEQFSPHCDLSLLEGSYLLNASKAPASNSGKGDMLTYFPISSLPLEPAARFSELFSVKQRWKVDEIQPFLSDLAVDQKKRDALTLKFTRKVKGDDGQNYYAARGR